jgi:flavin-dependent dehydrogenase
LAAAIALREKRFSVTVADGAKPPIDKACGEGLMPDTLASLQQLGVALQGVTGFALRGVRFVAGDYEIDANFPAGAGMGVRRPGLHQKMIERAAALGVSFLWETPVMGVSPAGALLSSGAVIPARWIIGADGSTSRVRQWSGLDAYTHCDSRFAYRRHYKITPWSDYSEVYWGQHTQVYITPVAEREICVAVVTRNARQRIAAALQEFPLLLRRLQDAPPASTERGAVTSMHRLARVTHANVALLGDASGTVDAITGEGLCLTFHQAAALATSLEHNDLAMYQQAHRRLARRPALMARMLLTLDRRPMLRRRVMRTFAGDPAIFQRFLAVHVGETSLGHKAATGARFGWKFLAA